MHEHTRHPRQALSLCNDVCTLSHPHVAHAAGAYLCNAPDLGGRCCFFPHGLVALGDDDDDDGEEERGRRARRASRVAGDAAEDHARRLCLSGLGEVRSVQLGPHTAVDVYADDLWKVWHLPFCERHSRCMSACV